MGTESCKLQTLISFIKIKLYFFYFHIFKSYPKTERKRVCELIMESKPWLKAPWKNIRWAAASSHNPRRIAPQHVKAIVLIKDANIMGCYVRVIQWHSTIDTETHFATYSENARYGSWGFKTLIDNMNVGDIVINNDGTPFKVVKKPDEFVAILEIVKTQKKVK